MSTSHIRAASLALAVVFGTMAPARVARADEHVEAAPAWGVVTFDVLAPLSLAAVWKWGSKSEATREVQYLVTGLSAFGLGTRAAGFGEGRHWEPVPPLVIHGAVWGGLDGFLIGGLIDGVRQGRTFATGPLAFSLAGAGALASGWLGVTVVDPDKSMVTWLLGPAFGGLAGVLLSAVPGYLLEHEINDTNARRMTAWFIASGVALGLIAGAILQFEIDGEDAPESASGPRPRSFMLPLTWQF